MEKIKDVIWEIDLNAVFTYISPTVKGLSGYEPKEMIGRSILDFLTEKSRRIIFDQMVIRRANGLKGDSPFYNVEFVCKDGHTVWCEFCVKPIFKDGALICYIGTTRDISEKKDVREKIA